MARSELIWSRLKGALGVPPELEEENDEFDDDEAYTFGSVHASSICDECETYVNLILPGDSPTCVGIIATKPKHAFGYGGPDGGMENIGEIQEDEGADGFNVAEKHQNVDQHLIQGLRFSNSTVDLQPVSSPRSNLASPIIPMPHMTSTASSAASRRTGIYTPSGSDPGRVRRSRQQERGTGDPLFPSSFATLTMGPSLVAK